MFGLLKFAKPKLISKLPKFHSYTIPFKLGSLFVLLKWVTNHLFGYTGYNQLAVTLHRRA